MIAEYKGSKEEAEENEDEEDLYIKEIRTKDEEDALKEAMEEGKEARFMARVKVPTQKDIEEALIRRKKQERVVTNHFQKVRNLMINFNSIRTVFVATFDQELLEMYAIDSDDLDQLEKQAKLTKEAPETTTVKADSNNKENNGTSDNNTTPMNVD